MTDTWDFFVACIGLFLRVSLEGLFDTHRYMTLLGYIKILQNTAKYTWGNTHPRFGGNCDQALLRVALESRDQFSTESSTLRSVLMSVLETTP